MKDFKSFKARLMLPGVGSVVWQVLAFVPGPVLHPDGAVLVELDTAFGDECCERRLYLVLLRVHSAAKRAGVIVRQDRNGYACEQGAGVVVVSAVAVPFV